MMEGGSGPTALAGHCWVPIAHEQGGFLSSSRIGGSFLQEFIYQRTHKEQQQKPEASEEKLNENKKRSSEGRLKGKLKKHLKN